MFEEGKSQEVGRAGRDGLISRCTLYHYGARRWTGPTAVCMEICSGKNTYVKQQNTHWTPGFPGFLAKKKDVGAEIGNIIGEKNIFFLANKGKGFNQEHLVNYSGTGWPNPAPQIFGDVLLNFALRWDGSRFWHPWTSRTGFPTASAGPTWARRGSLRTPLAGINAKASWKSCSSTTAGWFFGRIGANSSKAGSKSC